MKQYEVVIPIAGAVSVIVEADSEEQAMDLAMDCEARFNIDSDDGVELMEIEFLPKISQGNVLYAAYNEIEAEEL